MAKDKVKIPEILKGPVSPLGIRRDYDGDQNEIKADMIKKLDMNDTPPVPALVKKVPVNQPVDYDTHCPVQLNSPLLEETCGEDGATVSITVCPTSKSAGTKDVKYLVEHIKGYLKVGTILTWDIIQDINVFLDKICDQTKKLKGKDRDKD